LYISKVLWSRIEKKMNEHFNEKRDYIDYKKRMYRLLDDHDYKEKIEQLVSELPDDVEEVEDQQFDPELDYFNDPSANYCDYCGLNVFDCDC
jgi:hypothetical protein